MRQLNKDKRKLYILSAITLAVLLTVLLVDIEVSRHLTALLLIPIAVFTCIAVKRRRSLSIRKRDIILISSLSAVIYIVLKEMTGTYFGFYRNPYLVNADWLINYIIPSAIIIVASETVRSVMLAQDSKIVSLSTYLSCALAEVLMLTNIAGVTSYYRFMDLVGLTLFPAISANILYHYLSKRYGMLPNVIFRILTTLYVYFIPTVTGMKDSLDSCLKVILPILLLYFFYALFEKKKKPAHKKTQKLGWLSTSVTVVAVVSVAMLISCQFRFGALVIATDSMTGEINKGDMIIYERYDDQPIKEGQVVVFLQNEAKIVHRVVKIEHVGGELRYYTKGDANEDLDDGYRTDNDIVGLTDIKVAYIGYPTLWLRAAIPN